MLKKLSKKKKILFLIITGVLLTSVSVFATYLINSNEVEFDSTTNGLVDSEGNPVTDVQTAIDVLLDRVGTKYTITFNALNGSANTTIKSGTKQTVENLPTPTKEGKYFAGWYDAEVGGNRITESSVIDSNTTLYAHWSDSQFGADSWETIAQNVRNVTNDKVSQYNVGDTKEVDLGTYGVHTVRVSNNSHYDCIVDGTELESKTACGFVVEFVDIITTHRMNPRVSESTTIGENMNGGWLASEMRSWLNSNLLTSFPKELQNVISDTKTVSGHEINIINNYTTTDKLYLLSTHEIWENVIGNSPGSPYYDQAYSSTRQLDYYEKNSVTTSSHVNAIKNNGNSAEYWWLRSANRANNYHVFVSFPNGGCNSKPTEIAYGVSPAFRIE